MKGNPLRQFGLVLLLLGAAFFPVHMLTRHETAAQKTRAGQSPSPAPAPPPLLTGTLLLKSAPLPLTLSVTFRGRDLLQGVTPDRDGEYRTGITLPPDADLLVTARWKDDAPHAVRAEFRSEEGAFPSAEKSFWSGRELQDVLTLPSTPLAR